MPLALRIFLVYFLFVGLGTWFVFSTVMDEIKPSVRQSTEETLVDTANLLAEILREPVKNGTLAQSEFPGYLQAYGQRQPEANIWGLTKNRVNHRIYVTDAQGIVLLDSSDMAVGQDYSQWNDVKRTLQGHYGARSTKELADDESSTVMYVAAPIKDGAKILGVVTVAKPNRSLQPYINRSQRRLSFLGLLFIAFGLAAGGGVAWWLGSRIDKLKTYAQKVSAGERCDIPQYNIRELSALAQAIEAMRIQLEGKAYVETYVQTLTHELKSPLAAIAAAAELLLLPMSEERHQQFVGNISQECSRLEQFIERLLNLALIEQRQHLEAPCHFDVGQFLVSYLHSQQARLIGSQIEIHNAIPVGTEVWGEQFLVQQALTNLLENALAFTAEGGSIELSVEKFASRISLKIHNQGAPIPDYALPRIRERFYSLARPKNGRKSSGLGLNFVCEVMQLHQGELHIHNTQSGVLAELQLPLV